MMFVRIISFWTAMSANRLFIEKHRLEEKLQTGSVILDIEPNGAFNVKKWRPDAVLIFIAPPSLEELERCFIFILFLH